MANHRTIPSPPLSDRPPSAEPDRFQADRVITIAVGHAVHDTYTGFLPPLLAILIEGGTLTKTTAGLLSVFMQGPSLLQPAIGRAADRYNLRLLIILAPALTAITMSLLGVAPSYAILALLLVAVGTSSAGLHAVAPVTVGRLSGRGLGRGMGFWMVGGELGRFLGPIVVTAAVQLFTLRGTPWLMIGGLLASVILYFFLRDIPWQPPDGGQQLPWGRVVHSMGPVLLPLGGLIVMRAFMSVSLTTFLPTFLTEEGANLWFAGSALSILELAGVAGAFLGGWLSDRWGRRRVLFVAMLIASAFMFLFLVVAGWARLPLLVVLGFTSLSFTPVLMAIVQESFPQNRALANGVYMLLSFVLRSLVTVGMGVLGDWVGLRTAFTVSAGISLVGLPLILWLPGKSTPDRTEGEL